MKKFLKKHIVLALILSLIFTLTPFNVYAKNSEHLSELNLSSDNNKISLEIENLSIGESESKKIILSDGSTGSITVKKIAEFQDENKENKNIITPFSWSVWHTRDKISNGTYEVYVKTGVANAGFKIDVKNYNITKAYDPWHFMLISSVSGNLTLDSSKQATYFMNFSLALPWIGGPSWTGGVRARIEGTKLVTYWD